MTPTFRMPYRLSPGLPYAYIDMFAEMAAQKLAWTHGAERAASILAGTDPATNADLAAWRSLGRPKHQPGGQAA